jgi:tetratricopeptide (TPR) repeat protein
VLGVRAFAYLRLKQNDKAIDDYTQLIQLQPRNSAYHYRFRGDAYYNLKQYDKAISDYTEAIQLKPDDGGFYFSRALAYDKVGIQLKLSKIEKKRMS